MHPQCETCRGLRRVRSALQESDPLIYRVLIRLPLWRFDQAKDEISPSFCVCVSPPKKPSITALSLTGPLHHHTLHSSYDAIRGDACSCPTLLLGLHRRVCFLQAQSWLQTRLQLNGEFPLCASCISTTDFGVIFKAFVFVLHSVHNPSPVCSSHLCLTKVWIDYTVLDFSSGSVCALSWISHCPSQLLNRSELFW